MASKEIIFTDSAIASVGSKATYTGTGMTIFGWMTLNELAALSGIACAVIGVLINWYYKHKADKRDAARDLWEREFGIRRER